MSSTATKIAEFPLIDVAPESVRERITHPDFIAMLAELEQAERAHSECGDGTPVVERHRLYDALKACKERVFRWRLETAHLLDEQVTEGEFALPEGVEVVGDYEVGSVEWVAARQATVGGSDVGAICQVGQYGRYSYRDVREMKMAAPSEQEHNGYALIGDLWEPAIINMASRLLGVPVLTSKATYRDGIRHVNIDGFTLNARGGVDVVVEAKTSSSYADWAESAPEKHVLQEQHYVDVLGAREGLLIGVINDETVIAYRITPSDTVTAGPTSVKKIGERFSYRDVREYVEGMVTKWRQDAQGAPRSIARRRATFEGALLEGWKRAVERGVVYVDLETTTLSARTGHVLEFAGVRDDGEQLHRFFGVPDDHADWNGTGAVDVHRITASDVAGLPVLLESPQSTREIDEFIGNRVVVAHNASFERAWLTEAGVRADYADSMAAFSALVDDESLPANGMGELCAWAGVPYENAHRALADTLMLRDACTVLLPLVREAVITQQAA